MRANYDILLKNAVPGLGMSADKPLNLSPIGEDLPEHSDSYSPIGESLPDPSDNHSPIGESLPEYLVEESPSGDALFILLVLNFFLELTKYLVKQLKIFSYGNNQFEFTQST